MEQNNDTESQQDCVHNAKKMKQRVTYVVHNPDDFDPSQLRLPPTNDAFTLDSVNAAKEHRLTFGLSELPQEVRFEY